MHDRIRMKYIRFLNTLSEKHEQPEDISLSHNRNIEQEARKKYYF